MPDPNRTVYGEGWARLQEAGIATADFDRDLKNEIEEMNREFIWYHRKTAQRSPTSGESGQGKDNGGIDSPRSLAPLANPLTQAIDALLSFIQECTQVREDPRGAFGRFILRSEMDRFRELDTQVVLLAHEAGLLEALPRQDELKQQTYAPDVPMCRPNDPDVPLVQFEGKTNLPGDWTPDYFMPVWNGRWKEDMAVLRALAESRTADQSQANGGTGSTPSPK